jgi:hypothetical protein
LKPMFDATHPEPLGVAAEGAQVIAARRDHVHLMPALDDLTDVNTGAPDDNDVLTWDSGTSKWVADPAPAGGSVATDAIWDAKGDLAVGTGANAAAKLTVGADGRYLKAASGEATGLIWDTPAGSGDVVGPAGATDGHIALFDGATGKLIKDGGDPSVASDGWNSASGTWTPRSQAYTNDPAAGTNIELEMVDTSGFAVGDVIKVTSGTGSENALITVVHANTHLTVAALYLDHNTTTPSVKFADTLYVERAYTNDPAAGANIELNMADTTGFTVGDLVEVSSSAGRENATVTVVHASTHLTVNTLALNHTTTAPMVKQVVQNTFIVDTSGDLSATLGVGQRIKFTDSTVKYFILVAIATTRLTLYGGTDYTVVSTAAVTSPSYSMVKAPYGFPLSPTKWMVKFTDNGARSQATPSASTYYNPGGVFISIPIGDWIITGKWSVRAADTAAQLTLITTTLSTSSSAASDADFTSEGYISPAAIGGNTRVEFPFTVNKYLTLTTKTTYYPIFMVWIANIDTVVFQNESVRMIVRAVCAYL